MDIMDKLPAEVVCAVVKELTGKSLNFRVDEQRQESASILMGILSTPTDETLDRIAKSIEKHYIDLSAKAAELTTNEFAYVNLPRDFHDELKDDIATRAHEKIEQKFDLKDVVTPEELGFSAHEVTKSGPDMSVAQWTDFLLLAEKNVGRLKSRRRETPKHKYNFTLSCEKLAPNYELITIEHDSIVHTAKFLFQAKCLYVVIESDVDKNKEHKWVGEIDKVEDFSKGFVALFDGESDSANLALASVRNSLAY